MNNLFDKIKFSQLHNLCSIISDTELKHKDVIKSKYAEISLNFEETLSLLIELKIVIQNDENEYLKLSEVYFPILSSQEEFKKTLLLDLFSYNSIATENLRTFLLNFHNKNDNFIFKASDIDKIKYSSTRNLLLELDFINIDEDNQSYIINHNYNNLFLNILSKKILSPKIFKKKKKEDELIGLKAEKAVINYERNRLNRINISLQEIRHVALDNILAGYDIISYENYLDCNCQKIERYIEVKAVSYKDYKFYWSKNEIEISKILQEKYYLYLLPVTSKHSFDLNNIMIISNPYINIYLNDNIWQREYESLAFKKSVDK